MNPSSHSDVDAQRRGQGDRASAAPSAADEPRPGQTSEALRRYMQIVDTSSDVLGVIDRDYRYVIVNRQFCRYYGTTVEEAVGAHVAEFMGRAIFDRLIKERIDASFAGDDFKIDGIVRYPAAGERYMSIDSRPLYGAGGEIEGCVFSALDITEQRNAELARQGIAERTLAMQRLEALGQLAGGIAHEFNNLLTPILGFASLAAARLSELTEHDRGADPAVVRDVDEIAHAGERARDLVGHLLAYARGDQGAEQRDVDVGEILRGTVRLLSPLRSDDLSVQLALDQGLPSLLCVPVNLQQAVMNLCLNARDAMEAKGSIRISARVSGDAQHNCTSCGQTFEGTHLEIEVLDTGPGFEPRHLSRLFEPFFTTKEPGRGTGLGLAYVHGTVHGSGGHIVASTTPDGAAVRLLFPFSQPARGNDEPRPAASTEGNEGALIMVIDDDPLVGNLLAELLTVGGHHAVVFDQPSRALRGFAERADEIDLVIVDQRMAELEGDRLIEILRRDKPRLPAIVCTARTDMESVVHRLGDRTALLPKPVSEARLYELVATLTGKASTQQISDLDGSRA